MRLSDLLHHLDVMGVDGSTDINIRAVHHDSRQVGPADAFVAIPGAKLDGRRFTPGLSCAVVFTEGPVQVKPGVTVVTVPSARAALAPLAAALAGWPAQDLSVIGITGTNGKTTTAWLVEAMLAHSGLTCAVFGTTGHRVAGVPTSAVHTTPEAPVLQHLLGRARDAGCDAAVMEVSSIGLYMHRVDGIPFQIGVFTSFSQDHLDFHGSMARYLEAKTRLFTDLLAPGATAILYGDDPQVAGTPVGEAARLTYGRGPGHDVVISDVRSDLTGSRFTLDTRGESVTVRCRLVGLHNVENATASVCVGLAMGLPLATCAAGVATLDRVPGRLERAAGPAEGPTVLVDYAHTPDALERVLQALRPLTAGAIRVVFGCGGDRDRDKRPQMGAIAERCSDDAWVTSDNPRSEEPMAIIRDITAGMTASAHLVADRAQAIAGAVAASAGDDVVLIAGKGHEAVQIVAGVALPFDDLAVATQALSSWRAP